MNAPRHIRVIAALTEARGRWLNSDQLSAYLGCGRPQVAAAISEARAEGGVTIETHKFRGVGWRIAPSGEAPAPVKVAASSPAAQRVEAATAPQLLDSLAEGALAPRARAMLARLRQANGDFVAGQALADHCGCEVGNLSYVARQINDKLPALRVEALRGKGFRIGSLAQDGPAAEAPARAAAAIMATPHRAHRAAIDLLAALMPATAEQVRDIALQSEQAADDAIERLIWYGIEVHRDLIAAGEHPLQLARRAA